MQRPGRDAVIGVRRCIGLAVCGAQQDARLGGLARIRIEYRDPQSPPRAAVDPPADLDFRVLSAEGLEQPQARHAIAVRHVDDPLPVRRPARLEVVPVAERQLVGLAALDGQHVKVVELAAAMRAVDDARTVGRPLRPGAIERFLAQDLGRLRHCGRGDRRSPDCTGTQRDAAVRDEDHLVPVRREGRLDMQVLRPEVEPVVGEGVILSQPRGLPGSAVIQGHRVQVVPAIWGGRDVQDPRAVRGPNGIQVDMLPSGQGRALACDDIQQGQIDASVAVVGGVDDPASVG